MTVAPSPMDNPFVYSRPVAPEALIDRKREAAELLDLLRGGHHCRLSAPRRYGKTSLLHKVRADAEFEGLPTVYVNFYGILSLEEAVARLERGYRELRGPLARWVAGKLESIGLSVGTPLGTVSGSATPRGGAERRLHELLDLPRQLFTRSGTRAIVCFDEFQEVLSPRVALDGVIRSVIEQHRDEAAYVFAGSHPGMMRALFEERERPFFGQARAMALAPLAPEDVAEHVGALFEATDRNVGRAVAPLLSTARGHPQRVMLLSHFLWERTARGERADESDFSEALAVVQGELAEAFERTWRSLDDGERRAVVALLTSTGAPTLAAGLAAADAPRTTIVEALGRLTDAGVIQSREGRQELVDPLFAGWVARGRADA